MRRIRKYFSTLSLGLLVSLVLTLCSFATFAQHTNAATKGQVCGSTCNPHSQHLGLNASQQQEEEDKKEPVPPAFAWFAAAIPLSLLYVAPILAMVPISLLLRKHLLSTQLRY